MKGKIGMLIWKEMRAQRYTQAQFLKLLREKDIYIRDLFKLDTIDAFVLLEISILLQTNFFKLYEADELQQLLKVNDKVRGKVMALRGVVAEQDKLLVTQRGMIKEQEKLIDHLKALIEKDNL